MNTQQLYRALANSPLTEPFFDGIYAKDTLKDIQKPPKLIICNTDNSDEEGEHWLLFFFDGDELVEFYDSVGRNIEEYDPCFLDFVEKFSVFILSSTKRTQPLNSNL